MNFSAFTISPNTHAIDEINGKISEFAITQSLDMRLDVSAGAFDMSKSTPIIDGYTCFGILGFSLSRLDGLDVKSVYIDNNNVVHIDGNSNISRDIYGNVKLLYLKTY